MLVVLTWLSCLLVVLNQLHRSLTDNCGDVDSAEMFAGCGAGDVDYGMPLSLPHMVNKCCRSSLVTIST